MDKAVRKIHDFYAIKPGAPLYQKEFGFYVLDKWIEQGHLKPYDQVADYDAYLREVFGYDEPVVYSLGGLGWCEAEFVPEFETVVLEDRGEHELVQDHAGRGVLYFKGRRSGFMPEYVTHPVTDRKSWEEKVCWRMDPAAEGRMQARESSARKAAERAAKGHIIVQNCIGGYMYLRSLMGPEELLYMFYDDPELIHSCMQTWLKLADAVAEKHQQFVDVDELFLAEDICYNVGSLISPDMMREFLLPYYEQLYANIKARNRDKGKKVHLQIDTDGHCEAVLDVYRSIGCDYMSPFEVAAGCDIVQAGKDYPDLLLYGGIDKRILASTPDAIDRHIQAVVEPLFKRGGYIPTCDHGVPEEVSFENYMHFRKRLLEFA